VLWVQQRALH
jgi:hypothetical protein